MICVGAGFYTSVSGHLYLLDFLHVIMNGYDLIVFVVGILICEFPIYEVWKKVEA